MGLIKEIVLLPAAPVRLTFWVTQKVSEQAEREHFSTGAGVRKLQEIEQAREEGQIEEEEAAELEGQVLEQQMGAGQESRSEEGPPPGLSST